MNEKNLTESEKQYVSTRQVIRGVVEYLKAGRLEDGARLYSHCQEDVGYLLMTQVPREKTLQANLAKLFFLAKDYEKAAQVLEGMGEHQRAAELYERTDQYENAAEMWVRVGDLGRAAHNYEKAGLWPTAADFYTQTRNFERAAYCFEKAVNHFLAGKYYFQIQKYQKSMELLQKVNREEEHYLEAAVLIGNILAMHGYLDLAVAKYQSVAKAVPLSAGSLSVYYNLALLLERKGEHYEALKIYRRLAGVDPSYRDVPERIRAMEEKLSAGVEVVDAVGDEDLEVIEDLEPVEEEVTVPPGPPLSVATPQARIASVMDGFEFLKNTSLFERLSLSEMKRLWNVSETRQFPAGALLIEQDQPGQALFVVKRGKVKVQRVAETQVTDLVELGPGSHVGEMSLVDQAPTSARVVAGGEETEALVVRREKFLELLETDDKIAIKVYKAFIETLCDRLRKTTAELSELKAGGRA